MTIYEPFCQVFAKCPQHLSYLRKSLLLSVVWTAGLGSSVEYLEDALDKLEKQLQKELAGATNLPVAELVRTGDVSSALQVGAHTISVIFLPCMCITGL